MIRKPAVAGHFYPGEPEQLRRELEHSIKSETSKTSCLGAVVPHAGYKYSGSVAGEVYGQIDIPFRLVILAPNHTGEGVPYSIMPHGAWETPLGEARIDEALAASFMKHCPLLVDDVEAHHAEHSLEVQLPFLQYLKPDFSFVPVTLSYIPYERCAEIGHALARTLRETKERVLIVASSDMNHYEDQTTTETKDFLAIREIESVNPAGLYQAVRKNRISMCGVIPTTVMLVAARELGATKANLVRHATSGDVSGDRKSVVGYAGLIVV